MANQNDFSQERSTFRCFHQVIMMDKKLTDLVKEKLVCLRLGRSSSLGLRRPLGHGGNFFTVWVILIALLLGFTSCANACTSEKTERAERGLMSVPFDPFLHFYLPPPPPFIPPILPPVTLRINSCSVGSGPRIRWRADGRCGSNFPLSSNAPAECDPDSDRPCCSDYGYCGNSLSHCACNDCIDFRSVIREPSCYYSFDQETGILESPNFPNQYPPGRDCCYDIIRPSRNHCGVKITVLALDVGRGEEEGLCKRDWVTLPSCVPETGTRICGNETGQVHQYLFQPGATSMRFVFHAGDVTEGRKGFRIRYDVLSSCPGPYQTQNPPVSVIPGTVNAPCYTRITDARGTINTPYHPKKYPNDLDCVYEFIRTSPDVCGIRMATVTFDMDNPLMTIFGGACTDFLHLPSCGFLCGKINFSWVVAFQPGATSLKFHFHSDESEGFLGFLLNFEQVTDC